MHTQFNRALREGGLAGNEVTTRLLVWNRDLTPLAVPRAGMLDDRWGKGKRERERGSGEGGGREREKDG